MLPTPQGVFPYISYIGKCGARGIDLGPLWSAHDEVRCQNGGRQREERPRK